jgi:DNA-binding transcriptional LysR family regulator
MTRQAVSRQIAQLESDLGAQLFERTTARVELTALGEFYVNSFLDILCMWEDIQRKAEELRKEDGIRINIGCLYDLDLGDRIYHIVNKLRLRGENVYVHWERREPEELLSHLQDGSFDLVFTFDRDLAHCKCKEALESCVFQKGDAVIVVRDSHPVVHKGTRIEDFQDLTCIMAEQKLSNARATEDFHSIWARAGLKLKDVRIVPNRENMQTMVEMGEGFTIGTTMERFPHYPHMIAYPIHALEPLHILCIWRKEEDRPSVLGLISQIRAMRK